MGSQQYDYTWSQFIFDVFGEIRGFDTHLETKLDSSDRNMWKHPKGTLLSPLITKFY